MTLPKCAKHPNIIFAVHCRGCEADAVDPVLLLARAEAAEATLKATEERLETLCSIVERCAKTRVIGYGDNIEPWAKEAIASARRKT